MVVSCSAARSMRDRRSPGTPEAGSTNSQQLAIHTELRYAIRAFRMTKEPMARRTERWTPLRTN